MTDTARLISCVVSNLGQYFMFIQCIYMWTPSIAIRGILYRCMHGSYINDNVISITYGYQILTRFQGHYQDIKTKKDTTVARHFNKCPKENPTLFEGISISVLSFMHHPSDSIESQREHNLEEKAPIPQGPTGSHRVPQGLNLMD